MIVGRVGAACLALGILVAATAAATARAEPVLLGVLAHRGEDTARNRWQATVAYLSAALETPVELLPLTLEGVKSALETEELDFLLTNPGHYVALDARFQLSPIATLRRDRTGFPDALNKYGAVIVTRADRGDILALGDLRGKTFAAVSPDAFGGYQIAAHTLLRNGLHPNRDLKAINFLGFPQDRIVQAVVAGDVDAGTVRTGIIEAMIAENRLNAGQVKVLNKRSIKGFDYRLSTALYPEWSFAATRRASPELRRRVALALLSMTRQDRAAVSGRYEGWDTPVNDSGIREVMSALAELNEFPRQGTIDGWAWIVVVGLGAVGLLLVRRFGFAGSPGSPDLEPESAASDPLVAGLTRREHQVLDLIVSGRTNKEMARDLGISPKTVEFHRGHLMKKLNADSVAELVRIALGSGEPNR